MPEPRAPRLTDLDWADDVPGIRDRAGTVDGARWALVECAEGAAREECCGDGHRGLVLEGEIEYAFADGEPLRAAGACVPAAHRRRPSRTQSAGGATTMFLIDVPAAS